MGSHLRRYFAPQQLMLGAIATQNSYGGLVA
jgi:hypothetical protein